MGKLIPLELHNALQKVLHSYFSKPEIGIRRTVHNLNKNRASQLQIFLDATIAAMAAVA